MKKITGLILVFMMMLAFAVSCNYDPDDDVWVADEDLALPSSGSEAFKIVFSNVQYNGSNVTDSVQIYGSLLDSGWGTHALVDISDGAGTYENSSIAHGTYQIAALFIGDSATADWSTGVSNGMIDNSHGASNWTLSFVGFTYVWDMSKTVGPVEQGPTALIVR